MGAMRNALCRLGILSKACPAPSPEPLPELVEAAKQQTKSSQRFMTETVSIMIGQAQDLKINPPEYESDDRCEIRPRDRLAKPLP